MTTYDLAGFGELAKSLDAAAQSLRSGPFSSLNGAQSFNEHGHHVPGSAYEKFAAVWAQELGYTVSELLGLSKACAKFQQAVGAVDDEVGRLLGGG